MNRHERLKQLNERLEHAAVHLWGRSEDRIKGHDNWRKRQLPDCVTSAFIFKCYMLTPSKSPIEERVGGIWQRHRLRCRTCITNDVLKRMTAK